MGKKGGRKGGIRGKIRSYTHGKKFPITLGVTAVEIATQLTGMGLTYMTKFHTLIQQAAASVGIAVTVTAANVVMTLLAIRAAAALLGLTQTINGVLAPYHLRL